MMKTDLAIYGAGGLGRELYCLVRHINETTCPTWNFIGFFDDLLSPTADHPYGPILGDMDVLNAWPRPLAIILALGSSPLLVKIRQQITNPNISFPNLIAPDFICSDPELLVMGEGNVIQRRCVFSCHVQIGNFNIFNGSVVLAHDVVCGDFNLFMPAVRLSGNVTVGDRNVFGMNSCVLPSLTIGHDVTLGAGSVLMKSPKDGLHYIGIPAKKFIY